MQGLVEYLKVHNPAVVEGNEHMFDSPPGAMLLFLSDLRERHGSVEQYVRSIGLTSEQLTAMRDHLLDLD
jgi:protein-tyrosine phosphatase